MASSGVRRQIQAKLALIGPPGSGKGSYGRTLAQSTGIPLITVSDVLRQRRHELETNDPQSPQDQRQLDTMSSGKLVDDDIVSKSLLNFLSQQQQQDQHQKEETDTTQPNPGGYILDGFPRTIQQVQLMEDTWPSHLKIDAAVNLDIPAEVCERKLLGRRICSLCGKNYNVHGVLFGGFDLPPNLPRPGDCHLASGVSLPQNHALSRCDPDVHWKQREDDEKYIIQGRLSLHFAHTKPILEYFRQKNALFQFTHYKGYDDMPKFQSSLEQWLCDNIPNSITT